MSLELIIGITLVLLGLFLFVISLFLFYLLVVGKFVKRFVKKRKPGLVTRRPAFAMHLVDNPFRRKLILNPETIAARMKLEPGMTVLEIGPGLGSYTIAAAKRVLPDGKVYAIDIVEGIVEKLKKRFEKDGISNISPMVADAYNLKFSDKFFDRIFMISCLGEIPDPVKVLKECHRVLKTDGLLSLSELYYDPDYPLRRTEKRWAEEAGFEFQEQFGNWFAYQLNFKRLI